MKLSRTALLVLLVGVFVIVFGTLVVVHSRQSGEREQLNESLVAANARLPKVVSERGALEDQLAQRQNELNDAQSALSRAQSRLSMPVESIEYDEVLFSIAHDCDLEVKDLSVDKPSKEKVEDITYMVTTFEVEVRAARPCPATAAGFEAYIDDTVDNILAFVDSVAKSEDFTNATVAVVDMKNLEPPAEEKLEGAKKPSAIIKITVYKYEGE
jgi:cell division protein FtsB